jgi:hypothetical protein
MTFKEALEHRKKNKNLEHELRAAKIVDWIKSVEKINGKEAEKLYERLIDYIRDEVDSMDDVAIDLLSEIKEN